QKISKSGIRIPASVARALEGHRWPGNVRELVNAIERAVALTPSDHDIEERNLFFDGGQRQSDGALPLSAPPPRSLRERVREFERAAILEALERAGGSRTKAARELGLTRQGLALKIQKLGLGPQHR